MKKTRRQRPRRTAPRRELGPVSAAGSEADELTQLRAQLAEANGVLSAIGRGAVDAVVVGGKGGPRVFTLQGAERAYRLLIESMNEGALTLTAGAVILFANQCFAQMLHAPLERVMGSDFEDFLSREDWMTLRPHLQHPKKNGSKLSLMLKTISGLYRPVQVSVRSLSRKGGVTGTIAMVVTDMTEARKREELMRALTRRVVERQEYERGRVAVELHDNITQLLCAVLLRSQALANSLPDRGEPWRQDALNLIEMVARAAGEVERISRDLRPGLLDQLGLAVVLRAITREFSVRTGVRVRFTFAQPELRLPAVVELTLFRIVQQALANVETHARARHVVVRLSRQRSFVRLTISDDGSGFDPEHHAAGGEGTGGLGLLGMRERATYAGGILAITSGHYAGTKIDVRIPQLLATRPAE